MPDSYIYFGRKRREIERLDSFRFVYAGRNDAKILTGNLVVQFQSNEAKEDLVERYRLEPLHQLTFADNLWVCRCSTDPIAVSIAITEKDSTLVKFAEPEYREGITGR